MRIILPRNPNFSDFFFFILHVILLSWILFSYIYGFNIPFHMLVIRLLFHMFKLGFVLCFLVLMPWTRIHMFMHECHKSCIHIPMHLWIWFCLDDRDKYICLVEFFLKYGCNHIFSWIFLCLCCYLGYDMYDSNVLEFMLCHDRCMIRSFGDD